MGFIDLSSVPHVFFFPLGSVAAESDGLGLIWNRNYCSVLNGFLGHTRYVPYQLWTSWECDSLSLKFRSTGLAQCRQHGRSPGHTFWKISKSKYAKRGWLERAMLGILLLSLLCVSISLPHRVHASKFYLHFKTFPYYSFFGEKFPQAISALCSKVLICTQCSYSLCYTVL